MKIDQERVGLEKKFFELCRPVVEASGYVLYDLEYITGQKLLRLYIQDPKTATALIEDCVKVDHALSEPFETEAWIPQDITLEVSSPGVYRHLASLEHFKSSLQQMILVVILGQLNEEQLSGAPKGLKGEKKFRGKLIEVNPSEVVLDVKGFKLKLNYEQIKKANLDPDFKSIQEKGDLL